MPLESCPVPLPRLADRAAGKDRVGLPDFELAELHAEPFVPQRRRLHHWRRFAAATQRVWDVLSEDN